MSLHACDETGGNALFKFMKWYVLMTMLWIQVEDLSTGYSQYITGDSTAQ